MTIPMPSNETFIIRVRALYEHYKSARKVGQALGVHWVTIYRWLKGEVDVMKLPLRTYYAVMGGLSVEEGSNGNGNHPHVDGEPGWMEGAHAPVFEEGVGLGGCLDATGKPSGIVAPVGTVARPTNITEEEAVYGVRITSMAMAPAFLPGQTVLVNPSRDPLPGDYVMVRLRTGDVLVRRYDATEGKIVLTAANQDYPVQTVSPERIDWMRPILWVQLR